MKHSVKFIVDKRLSQIYLIFNSEYFENEISGEGKTIYKRLKYYTGCRIEYDKWDKSKQRVKDNQVNSSGQTSSIINRELDKIQKGITDIYETRHFLKQEITPEILKNELKIKLGKALDIQPDNLFYYYEKYIKIAKVSDARRRQLKVTMNHFKRFLKNENIEFHEITNQILSEFQDFLRIDKKPKGANTISTNLKRLRTFFGFARQKNWTTSDPFKNFNIIQENYGEPIYLTKDERDLLYNTNLTDNPRLEKVRDIFIFQCLIGARVGDLIKLKHENIINGNLTYIQNKTKDEKPVSVSIPLTPKAKSILSKYNLPDSLLPFIAGQNYNDYLKELFTKVGLTRNVVRLNPNTGIQEIVRLCDIASSHMARRTFIGVMYENGIKNDVIGSMSGHVKGSKAFGRYYSVSENLKKQAISGLD